MRSHNVSKMADLVGRPATTTYLTYRALLDCDTRDAARVFVSLLYLGLFNTRDAVASIALPVWLALWHCDRTDPASCRAIDDELLSLNVAAACAAILGDDFFELKVMLVPMY